MRLLHGSDECFLQRLHSCFWRARGNERAVPGVCVRESVDTALLQRWDIRQCAIAFSTGDGEDSHLARAMELKLTGKRICSERHVPAYQVRDQRRAPFVRDRRELRADGRAKRQYGKVKSTTEVGQTNAATTWLSFHPRRVLRHGLVWAPTSRRDHCRHVNQVGDRQKIPIAVVVEALVCHREQHKRRAGAKQHGPTICWRALNAVDRDPGGRAGSVLDHHDFTRARSQLFRYRPGQRVQRAPRRKTDHEFQRRFFLRLDEATGQR